MSTISVACASDLIRRVAACSNSLGPRPVRLPDSVRVLFAYSESKLTSHFVFLVLVLLLVGGTESLKGRKKVEIGCLQLINGYQI